MKTVTALLIRDRPRVDLHRLRQSVTMLWLLSDITKGVAEKTDCQSVLMHGVRMKFMIAILSRVQPVKNRRKELLLGCYGMLAV